MGFETDGELEKKEDTSSLARKPSPCGGGIGGWLSSWLKYAAPKCEEVGSEEGGAGAESRNADGGSLS